MALALGLGLLLALGCAVAHRVWRARAGGGAIRRIAGGDAVCSPWLAVEALHTSGAPDAPEAVLTEDQHEVLLLIASGYTREEIAARMRLPVATIEAHTASVLRELHLTDGDAPHAQGSPRAITDGERGGRPGSSVA